MRAARRTLATTTTRARRPGMNPFDNCIEILSRIATLQLRWPKNDDVAQAGQLLAESYLSLESRQAAELRALIDDAMRRKLLGLAIRCAEKALNSGDPAWVRTALVLQAIEGFDYDYRESLRAAVPIRYAAWKTAAPVGRWLEELRAMASESAASRLD
ncbi:MAG: hypothetical protein JF591_16350 [Lysobacter sp.]|nr:hypothetical protein [Lysobacter sp.]